MPAEVERDDGELAVLLFTSGTAGAPRAAMLTHGNLAANIGQVQSSPGPARSRADDVGLAMLPFFHVFGLNVALGVGAAGGHATVLLAQFDAGARGRARPPRTASRSSPACPAMFAAFLELSDDRRRRPTRSRRCASPSPAPPSCPLERAAAFLRPLRRHDLRGLRPHRGRADRVDDRGRPPPRWGSIGPPLPGVDVRLVDADGERRVPSAIPARSGCGARTCSRGTGTIPTATARVLADGWLRTGDVAVSDDDGFLSLVDRMKDLVIVSGFNVYPGRGRGGAARRIPTSPTPR